MPTLTGSVGQGGTNLKHEVALVQLMFRLIRNPKGQPYVTFDYDGICSPGPNGATFKAIKAFQADHKTAAGPPKESEGKIEPNGKTFRRMAELLPATHKDLRMLEGQNPVLFYVAGTQMEANAAAARVTGDPKFTEDFKSKVADLIRKFYSKYGIVLNIAPAFANGGFRTFDQQQKEFKDGDSQAGPGESYHNWGNGADVGMDGFAGLKKNGQIGTYAKSAECNPIGDGPWLTVLEGVNPTAATKLWKLRNDLAAGSLYPTSLENDLAHLQTFSDAKVAMRVSLAAHLSEWGDMWWEYKSGAYRCNYGLTEVTDDLIKVGTAWDIWDKKVDVPGASLATALNKAAQRRAAGPLPYYEEAIYNKIVSLHPNPPKVWALSNIKKAQYDQMRLFFRNDFELAEANYADWKPLDSNGKAV
jgi:hypothetical protein